jgi:acyl-ACP thioesterase
VTVSELAPLPERGRRFTATRTVRLGDAGLDGALRLDALARFLQDVAADDAAAVGLREASWVVRRTTLVLDGRPLVGERIELTTFCGGLGSRWAERRTSVVGPSSRIEASSVWVYVDEATARPSPLPPLFLDAYAEAAGGRTVSSRLTLPLPGEGGDRTAWPLRSTDFDVLGHVNNSVYWAIVEEDPPSHGVCELEYRLAIEPGADVHLVVDGDLRWLVSGAGVHAAARTTARLRPDGERRPVS